ncbi:DNA-directed DNA polymerase [Pediococcus pentosaceus]|uniref:DNA-directed DNA polymerase n=1 Tax=Pediococcus pentosaceus TaxID=1255 RepID=A0A1Y0VX96_PEDPE|nr:DNA-directed DNA polymerase [Pediococcus pentosaceus]
MEDLKNLTNQAVEKQPEIVKRFNEMIDSQHLSHAYLLTGAGGIGKKDVAQWVAMRLFVLTYRDQCLVENVKSVLESCQDNIQML